MIYRDTERRKWKRHSISILVRLIFPSRGIKGVQEINMRLIDISEGGASIASEGLTLIPDYFYLEFQELELGLVSSYMVKRTEKALHCKFCHEIRSQQLELVVNCKQTDARFSPSISAPIPTKPASNSNVGSAPRD